MGNSPLRQACIPLEVELRKPKDAVIICHRGSVTYTGVRMVTQMKSTLIQFVHYWGYYLQQERICTSFVPRPSLNGENRRVWEITLGRSVQSTEIPQEVWIRNVGHNYKADEDVKCCCTITRQS